MKNLREKRRNLQDALLTIQRNGEQVTFHDFLASNEVTLQEYLEIVRSKLQRPTLFLRRTPNEGFINPYNKEILQLHSANMDIQFILDTYSCASYVLNYINKARRGLSKLMHDAIEDVKRGNLTLYEKMRTLGNCFLNASEFSAQEAVYYTLGMYVFIHRYTPFCISSV